MVSFGHTKGTKSTTTPIFQYLPGQLEYLPQYAKVWKDIFAGNFASPTAQALQTAVGEAGMREGAQQRRSLAETRGISTVARQRGVADIAGGVTKTMAAVPQELFSKAAEWLGQFTLQAPAVGYSSRTTGGGGWNFGLCSCDNLKALNEGFLVEAIRRFRDEHFAPLSDIDIGYKAMADWFVPLVNSNPFVKFLGRLLLFHPICRASRWLYGEDELGFAFVPVLYFWVWFWRLYGRITKKRYDQRTPRSLLAYYPSMSLTFLHRLWEVI